MMKILSVKKIVKEKNIKGEKRNRVSIHVRFDDDGIEKGASFDGGEWLEKNEKGEEKFLERIKENKRKDQEIEKKGEPKEKKVTVELNKFEGREI